ncbi:MAG: hypothetical protein IIA44_12025 [Acidobacteria bacterium]|nr:hypothetical protein [Acidobacteriota bacterium]
MRLVQKLGQVNGGAATSASLSFPFAVAVDTTGNLFIVDRGNVRIRRVDATTGIITTVAGNGVFGFSGDGGPATSAALNFPGGVTLDAVGNLFVADQFNNRIRRVDAGADGQVTGAPDETITTVAGDGSFTSPLGVALDAAGNLFFTETFGFTGQFVKSYGEYGRGTVAFFVRPSYDSATGHAHVRYTHLGDRFADNVNVIGFIRDDDRRELDGAVEKTFWVRSGAIERVNYVSENNIYWGQTAVLRSWVTDQSVRVDWRNRWTTGFSHIEEFKRFEKDFRNRQTELELGYNTRSYESVRGGFAFGRNFDADFQLWTAAATYTVTEKLSAEYELQRLELDPDPENESTWIHVIRANQFFTPDLFLRVFFQTNSTIDRRNVQAVFVYRYLPPFGTLQIAYQRGTAEFGARSNQGHTVFVKLTTVL